MNRPQYGTSRLQISRVPPLRSSCIMTCFRERVFSRLSILLPCRLAPTQWRFVLGAVGGRCGGCRSCNTPQRGCPFPFGPHPAARDFRPRTTPPYLPGRKSGCEAVEYYLRERQGETGKKQCPRTNGRDNDPPALCRGGLHHHSPSAKQRNSCAELEGAGHVVNAGDGYDRR